MTSVKLLSLVFHFLTCISTVAYARCTEPVPAGAIFGCETRFYCYKTGNLTSSSTYARNRDLILATLASNATAHGGFYTSTIGTQDADKVYSLVFCRPDSSSEACSNCVNVAIQDLVVGCPYQKEVISWGWDPPCIVRYANRSLFGLMESYPTDFGCNPNNITSNMDQFDQIWGNLMENLVNKTATTGLSNTKFATGEADWVSFQKIYALMTCTPDISQTNCSYCLREAVDYYNRQCHGRQGGFVQKTNCIMRWDLYPFYKISADAPGSPPLPTVGFSPQTNRKGSTSRTVIIITIIPTIILLALLCFSFHRWKSKQWIRGMNENSSEGCLELNFATIRLATNNFSDDNKLGQGGFGAVYKGRLSDGQTIAVKRLSRNSRQGEVEFKNEVLLMTRLRHRNLSKLLGFCLEGNERLLIYEYLQNSSLDKYIFDPNKRSMLDWEMCYKIIVGIARGILYLHEESQLRIIHRDLKASNILLDEEMNPKISDFGMARLFELDRTHDTTSRVAGTFGYMAPEYAIRGRFSVKSDVFSFGVLLLEIISGKRNSTFCSGEEDDGILAYAWKNWNEGTTSKLIDATLLEVASRSDVNRCIHIGLLCVQENVANRPTMGSVVVMLSSFSFVLPIPSMPAFLMHSSMKVQIPSPIQSDPSSSKSHTSKSGSVQSLVNEASVTDIHPR